MSPEKSWIPNSNSSFLKKMLSTGISSDAEKPVFSFYYLRGAHRPWLLDEKCNIMDSPFDNPNSTTRSCFHILSEFIRLLKDLNIYDITAIFVCSDHGGGDSYSTPYDMSFMIKPFHENKKELSIDSSNVQSIDILPTLLMMACADNANYADFDGFIPPNVPKERIRKVHRLAHMEDYPVTDPDLIRAFPGFNCIEEYNFVDVDSFRYGIQSKSFVRQIPLIMSSQVSLSSQEESGK